ncbi:MAG: tRNA 4-thiouridine(8) synthase ThiI [Patescibacteria group bacterium]|nr:tRNA 4-thiouridine(8) synthase ThiI [Patescibacteria group bacterium]
MKKRKIRALVLFSGGLDSLLAIKILENLGLEITALIFKSLFFDAKKAKELAKEHRLEVIVINFSKKHLRLVKNPRWGRGKNMNPCLDCHLLMLNEAKRIMKEGKFELIATGEVLGQRSMSQNKQALRMLEKRAGLEARILRPLSARALEETEYEKQGLVERKKLLNIQGKKRNRQLELVRKYKLLKYSTPSGGCLLTDPCFSERLKKMFKHCPDCREDDVQLLKMGRIFWINNNLAIIGRHERDNKKLLNFWKTKRRKKDVRLRLCHFDGPIGFLRNLGKEKIKEQDLRKIGGLLGWYYPKIRDRKTFEISAKAAGDKKSKRLSVTLEKPL